MISSKEAEFDVLGLRVKSKPEADEGKITTKEIVDLVNREALKLKEKSPGLDNGKVAILLALEFARDKLSIERDFRESVLGLHESGHKILELLEQVNPSSL
ncbi:MAG: hypothetical protein ACOYL6_09820 [Bacteriovoracaceae bacterium]